MSLTEQLFSNKDSESELAIAEYYKDNKEKLLKYPNMVPTFDPVTKIVYCVYKPRNLDDLLQTMKRLPKKEVDLNLMRYDFWEQRDYAYQQLGLKIAKREVKKYRNSTEIIGPQKANMSELANFFSFAYNTDANVFVHLLNKETGENYFYPINSLKDKIKLSSILHSHIFCRNVDLMYSLSTYKTMIGATDENVFSIPLIQVDVDYRKIPKYKTKTPMQVWQSILETEVGNTIPYPSAIECGHQLRLLYKLNDLYVNQSSKASKNIARRISKVFAERLSKYGAEFQPITSHGRIASSINSKDGSIVQIELFGHEYEIEIIKEKWLDPLPDWYSEWKSKPKKKGKVIYLQNTLTLNTTRLRDFFRIVDYYNGQLDGRRFLCFMVRSHALLAGYSLEEARDLMLELNDHFKFPLRPNLIEQDTRNVVRKQYSYKNETILERLCITPEIEENMNLETIISITEKKRRDKVKKSRRYREEKFGNPNISKRELIEAEKKEIKKLLAEGYKKKEICKLLGIQPKTLQRRIKGLKNEGFLQ
ncbi:helix-turn-helix domain-containing protein [Gracilibacillus salinarum]|uniref:Helix-turn-helix domain-containing protein n=1 Tax=Gracilibacillus salinarum TaxID=2932255 RepID=A0ABY4GL01_9BACI|nr:helix-turn-helix domain-containing protein [Gracilibacillus salinarum]UOQ84635.1 helix-turn-helix domain-containing protein [Gracilibacillus salinarum]